MYVLNNKCKELRISVQGGCIDARCRFLARLKTVAELLVDVTKANFHPAIGGCYRPGGEPGGVVTDYVTHCIAGCKCLFWKMHLFHLCRRLANSKTIRLHIIRRRVLRDKPVPRSLHSPYLHGKFQFSAIRLSQTWVVGHKPTSLSSGFLNIHERARIPLLSTVSIISSGFARDKFTLTVEFRSYHRT